MRKAWARLSGPGRSLVSGSPRESRWDGLTKPVLISAPLQSREASATSQPSAQRTGSPLPKDVYPRVCNCATWAIKSVTGSKETMLPRILARFVLNIRWPEYKITKEGRCGLRICRTGSPPCRVNFRNHQPQIPQAAPCHVFPKPNLSHRCHYRRYYCPQATYSNVCCVCKAWEYPKVDIGQSVHLPLALVWLIPRLDDFFNRQAVNAGSRHRRYCQCAAP